MNRIDSFLLLFLNQFADHWRWLDWLVTRADHSNLITAGVLVFLAWYALFDRNEPDQLRKGYELLLGSILLSGVSVVTARALALTLPFRNRPIWTPDLHFHLPLVAEQRVPLGWSSFPSDHAVLYATVVTGIFFVSRRVGWLAAAWAAVVGCFPLLYLGIHWPSDIVAGALLGVAFAQVARIPVLRSAFRQLLIRLRRREPGLFFALLFFGSYQVVTLFDDGRRIATRLYHVIKNNAPLLGGVGFGIASLIAILIAVGAAVWAARRLSSPRRVPVSRWTNAPDVPVTATPLVERKDQTV